MKESAELECMPLTYDLAGSLLIYLQVFAKMCMRLPSNLQPALTKLKKC